MDFDDYYGDDEEGISIGWIIGGAIALILLIAGAIFFFNNKKTTASSCAGLPGRREVSSGQCSTKYGYGSVAIVTGNTANSMKPSISGDGYETIRDIIADPYFSASINGDGFDIPVISVASVDKIITENKLEPRGINMEFSQRVLGDNIEKLSNVISTEPSVGGANYFDSIVLANDLTTGKKKRAIIVIGSGLSDSGTISFADGELFDRFREAEARGNSKQFVESIARGLPFDEDTFRGADIYWANIGRVTPPQEGNPGAISRSLKVFYSELFEQLGASKFETLSTIKGEDETQVSVDTNKKVKPINIKPMVKSTSYIDEDIAEFKGDSNNFVEGSEEKVRKYLEEKIIPGNEEEDFELTGFIAICTQDDKGRELAMSRANRIKDIMVKDMRIDSSRIKVNGYAGQPPSENDEAANKEYSCRDYNHMSEAEQRAARTIRIKVLD